MTLTPPSAAPNSEGGELADRLDELRAWSASRIRHCRELEQKFGTRWSKKGPPQTLVEAWTERQSLEAVRRILGFKETP